MIFFNFQKAFFNFSFCICKLAVAFYMINEIQPKIKFQNIVQCPFNMAANVQQVQLRGRYQQIIDQDRGRLIDAFENDDADYFAVANTLGIKHLTSA